jgi:hypothetical protein
MAISQLSFNHNLAEGGGEMFSWNLALLIILGRGFFSNQFFLAIWFFPQSLELAPRNDSNPLPQIPKKIFSDSDRFSQTSG